LARIARWPLGLRGPRWAARAARDPGTAGSDLMADDRWLVAGLGNPGPQYAANRHNVGFMVADLLAARIGTGFRRDRSRVQAASGRLAGLPVTIAKPMSFMNLAGPPLAAVAGFYKIPPDRIVAVHDELDLPFGTIRLKLGGGDSGHNGLRSVTRALGTRDYYRVRVGIGRPPGRQDPADFVLRDFAGLERKEVPLMLERAADAVEALLRLGLAPAQNEFHPAAPAPPADPAAS
jgi:PTH1 family peptidyl-tRNA hydrolase